MTTNFLAEYGAQADTMPGATEAQVFRLPDGSTLPWRIPQGTSADAPARHVAAQGLRAIAGHAATIKAIEADADHSESWKAAKRSEATERLRADGAAALARADAIVAAFETADAREDVPLPLLPADLAGALQDHECRAYVRGLDRDAQVALAAELTKPEHARMVDALMRSRVPLSPWIDAPARAAWVEHQARANPAAAAQRAEARALVDWLRGMRQNVAGHLERLLPKRSN